MKLCLVGPTWDDWSGMCQLQAHRSFNGDVNPAVIVQLIEAANKRCPDTAQTLPLDTQLGLRCWAWVWIAGPVAPENYELNPIHRWVPADWALSRMRRILPHQVALAQATYDLGGVPALMELIDSTRRIRRGRAT